MAQMREWLGARTQDTSSLVCRMISEITDGEKCAAYEVFINPSTIGAARPAGFMAGANAMNTLIF
jgi:hypothetical protein